MSRLALGTVVFTSQSTYLHASLETRPQTGPQKSRVDSLLGNVDIDEVHARKNVLVPSSVLWSLPDISIEDGGETDRSSASET